MAVSATPPVSPRTPPPAPLGILGGKNATSWDLAGEGTWRSICARHGLLVWREAWHNAEAWVVGTELYCTTNPTIGLPTGHVFTPEASDRDDFPPGVLCLRVGIYLGDSLSVGRARTCLTPEQAMRRIRAAQRLAAWLLRSDLARKALLMHPDRRWREWAVRRLLGDPRPLETHHEVVAQTRTQLQRCVRRTYSADRYGAVDALWATPLHETPSAEPRS